MGNASRGFTIIETILFLGISGLLILIIVAGAGTNINIQRYRDAVESFKSEVRAQYTELASVQNSRTADFVCGANAKPVDDSNGELPGQSDCMIAGKYLRLEGSNIASYTVLAYQTVPSVASGSTDIQVMTTNYTYNTAEDPDSDKDLDWGTSIGWPSVLGSESSDGSNPRTLGILVLRSPYSGQIYTFTSNSVPAKDDVSAATFSSLMVDTASVPGRAARAICIQSNGLFVDDNQSLYIAPNAMGPTGVEVTTNAVLAAKGMGSKC